jgi:hypothetical protein
MSGVQKGDLLDPRTAFAMRINATTDERPVVRIDNLNDPYRVTLLVAARRVKP